MNIKSFYLIYFIFLSSYFSLFSQENYIPIDTSNLKGKIERCSVYEYTSNIINPSKELDFKSKKLSPSIIYFFSRSKKITKISYPLSNKNSIFIYDKNEKLDYQILGDMGISEKSLNISNKEDTYEFSSYNLYKNPAIFEIKKYHYNNNHLMITSSNNLPPSFIYFDKHKRIIKTIQYYYDDSALKKSTTEFKYKNNKLDLKIIIGSNSFNRIINFDYNQKKELISKIEITETNKGKITNIYMKDYDLDQSKNLTIKNGNIIKEIKCRTTNGQMVCDEYTDNVKNIEISYFDGLGNKIKEYKKMNNKFYVKEWHFKYYEEK